ncbi:CYTH domain-containing protein [Lacticaseibacillus pabuli]|uniref:CYTH domain-containing protein n=1 Tax=Lacticaseibacillus pabuli TaxID=3025672 RepID=A0ABY7WPC1_9LACO|nr:CYTH domain-containing protein [Lacticaseibacillus sp. KACC 23028]WDF82019.1 CYTH domain-containing protein [Lacticaseibacillus sp. KACC 23028]
MSIETERELKSLITQTQAQQISQAYPFAAPFEQTNVYFDTVDNAVREAGAALRIRRFSTYAELTLKLRQIKEKARTITEFTDRLDTRVADELIKADRLPETGTVADELTKLGVARLELRKFAQMTTRRRECELPGCKLVLDDNYYMDGSRDWEAEIEYTEAGAATELMTALSTEFHIEGRRGSNKIARATAHMPHQD